MPENHTPKESSTLIIKLFLVMRLISATRTLVKNKYVLNLKKNHN